MDKITFAVELERLGENTIAGLRQTWMTGTTDEGGTVALTTGTGMGSSALTVEVTMADGRHATYSGSVMEPFRNACTDAFERLVKPQLVAEPLDDRGQALWECSNMLDGMLGTLQEVLARLHDHPDVTEATLAARKLGPLIEAANDAVLTAMGPA